jgi:signal peptidase complex subunit 1
MCEQIVAFIVGFVVKDLKYTVWIGLGGTALTALAVVPPWPMYNRNGLKWLPVEGGQGKKTQ